MKTPLDRIYDAAKSLTEASASLASVSRALDRVGLDTLADEIASIAACVHDETNVIRRACNDDLSEKLKSTQQATANMVGVALAMAKRE